MHWDFHSRCFVSESFMFFVVNFLAAEDDSLLDCSSLLRQCSICYGELLHFTLKAHLDLFFFFFSPTLYFSHDAFLLFPRVRHIRRDLFVTSKPGG